jgi:hypothetical protein
MRALRIAAALAVVAAAAGAPAPARADTPPADEQANEQANDPDDVSGPDDVQVADETAAPALPPIDPNAPLRPPALAPLTGAQVQPPAEAPAPRGPKNYRVQVIVADAAAVALSFIVDRVSSDGNARPDALATFTIATYFFTAPAIHGVHREGRRALLSFGLRAGLPLLLGFVGEQIDGAPPCEACQDSLRSDGKVFGLTAGVLLAMAIDGALLARPTRPRAERPRAAWTPAVHGVPGGALAGLAGTF